MNLTKSLAILLAFFTLVSFAKKTPSADQILKMADDNYIPADSLSVTATVKDFMKDNQVGENTYLVYSKNRRLTMVKTEKPRRMAGRKLLMAGGLWLYLPSLKRPTRVSTQQKLTGEVANGDIARASFSTDYRAVVEGIKTVDGKKAIQLKLAAKNKSATYRNVRLWVDAQTYLPLRTEYYALSGKLLKTGQFGEIESVFGKKRVTQLVIRDGVMPQKSSVLKYSGYKKEDLDDSFFNKESLVD